jgi:hypothetical protein
MAGAGRCGGTCAERRRQFLAFSEGYIGDERGE